MVLASTWQPAYDSTSDVARTDAQYCDESSVILTADLMEKDFTTQGPSFTSATKCTYIIETNPEDFAPAFALTSSISDGSNFDQYTLSYYEYTGAPADVLTAIGTATLYPATPLYPQVTYAAGNTYNLPADETIPGHINECMMIGLDRPIDAWYTVTAGGFTSCDSVQHSRGQYLKYVADFAVVEDAYEANRSVYEARLTLEVDRLADFFGALFDTPIEIPAKPMAPTPPGTYAGEFMLFNQTEKTNWLVDHPAAIIAQNDMSNFDTSIGYLETSDGVVGEDMSFAYSGHVFGVGGQGAQAMPADGVMAW